MSQPPDDDLPSAPPQFGPPGQVPSGQYPFGQPSYVPPPYGPPVPPWGPAQRSARGGRGAAIVLIVVGAMVLATVGIAALFLVGRNKTENLADSLSSLASVVSSAAPPGTKSGPVRPYQPRSTNTLIPPPTVPPTGLGSDPALDRQARHCYNGDMQACDDLFANSAANSLYEAYGDTCAGRQPAGRDVYCTTVFPWP
jgi:hypothetical protein